MNGSEDVGSHTTHHVLWADSDEVLLLIRIRRVGENVYGEVYRRGYGWVEDARAFDVNLNGQDYDLVDREEAEALAREMEQKRA